MNEVKIMFFDIDGTTFYNKTQSVPESTKSALKKARDKGIKLVINTSRSTAELVNLPKEYFDLFDAMICEGGALIKSDGKPINQHLMNKEDARKAIDYFDSHNLIYTLRGPEIYCINKDDKDVMQHIYDLYHIYPPVRKWNGEDLYLILFYDEDSGSWNEVEKLVTDCRVTHVNLANEVANKKSSKGLAMLDLCRLWNIDVKETAGFGDGNNDLEMIRTANYGIAMGNASDKLKKEATYVTDSILEDGLYKAMVHFGWID